MALKWDGLDELKAALRDMPADLARDAEPIVYQAANEAHADALARYPEGLTGNLRDGLEVAPAKRWIGGRFGASVRLVNRAPHAEIFENGTAARHTWRKFRAYRGSMPPGRVFIPAVERARGRMWDRLGDLLERYGFVVRGRAA